MATLSSFNSGSRKSILDLTPLNIPVLIAQGAINVHLTGLFFNFNSTLKLLWKPSRACLEAQYAATFNPVIIDNTDPIFTICPNF